MKSDFCGKLLLLSVLRYFNHCCLLYSELKLFMSTVCIGVMSWTGNPSACVRSLLVTIFTFPEKVWVKRDITCPKPNQMTCATSNTGPKVCHLRSQHSFLTPLVKGSIKNFLKPSKVWISRTNVRGRSDWCWRLDFRK